MLFVRRTLVFVLAALLSFVVATYPYVFTGMNPAFTTIFGLVCGFLALVLVVFLLRERSRKARLIQVVLVIALLAFSFWLQWYFAPNPESDRVRTYLSFSQRVWMVQRFETGPSRSAMDNFTAWAIHWLAVISG